ncbi:FRG domain-containing protein [Glaesserella parasuis]|nr:FRG domain-containing protein [Glaesserella parasuis]MCT8563663.1 FRG domain-containing protein [Glaesserella parasuis]
MTNITSIADLANFLVQPTNAKLVEMTRFFRGHSNKEFKLEPSIYREKYLIQNEDKIIKDALMNCPSSFQPNSTLFDKLVTLQHYGYKTRLLDITTNALVALYFAVESNPDKDGEIIIFDIPTSEIKYDSSDRVAILSAISMRNSSFSLTHAIETAKAVGDAELATYLVQNHENLNVDSAFQTIANFGEHGVTKEMIQKSFTAKIQDIRQKGVRKSFNEYTEIVKLIHDIRNDKHNFDPIINYNDFNQVLCVRAKLDNQRIIRQQGAFLLFGMQESSKLTQANITASWIKNKLVIPKDSKNSILESLKSFGISK